VTAPGTPDVLDVDVDVTTGIARVVLDRPAKMNALDLVTLQRLSHALATLGSDDRVHVVQLTGAGPTFCAGADLDYVESIRHDPVRVREFLHTLKNTVVAVERLRQPVVVAVQGLVLAGGLELMLGGDVVIAAASTRLGDQHVNFGFIPGGGSTQRLPRRVGAARAMDLLLTGRWLTAAEALEAGLVSRVVDDESLQAATDELSGQIAGKSPAATAAIKRLVRRAGETDLGVGLDEEIDVVVAHYEHPDFEAGLAAFRARSARRSG
jgi:enoyl-CoA hydratase